MSEIKRGDVYYLRQDWSYGHEIAVGRPCVIVSSDFGNESETPITQVLMMTTTPRANSVTVEVHSTKKLSWVLCNQINSVDRTRLGDFMCHLTDEEMDQIDNTLAYTLGLELRDDSDNIHYEEEIRNLENEIRELEYQLEAKETTDLNLSLKVERDLYKKLYETALDKLVGKMMVPVVEPAPVPEEKVDLNNCDLKDLLRMGMSSSVARMVIAARPFKKIEELQQVPGVTRVAYELFRTRITVGEIPVVAVEGKVNVNTDSWQDIVLKWSISPGTAKEIVAYRNKNGRYNCPEDLLNLSRFGNGSLRKYRDVMEF